MSKHNVKSDQIFLMTLAQFFKDRLPESLIITTHTSQKNEENMLLLKIN